MVFRTPQESLKISQNVVFQHLRKDFSGRIRTMHLKFSGIAVFNELIVLSIEIFHRIHSKEMV